MANEEPTKPAWALAAPSEPPSSVPVSAPSSTEILAATIGGAVERQLTQSVATMTQQVEAARAEMGKEFAEQVEAVRAEARRELAEQVEAVRAEARKELAEQVETVRGEARKEYTEQVEALSDRVATGQETNDRYQAALQAALEERLAEFANHQHQTVTTLNNKLAGIPSLVQFTAVSEGLRDYLEHKTATVEGQIDELHKSSRRFDDQVAAVVASINETVAALSKRMDDGDQVLSRMVEQRIGDVRVIVDQSSADLARQLAEHSQILSQRVDSIDMKMVDRAMAMEERINEHNGVKIANLDAAIGRIGAGFDDAMGALSKRLVDMEAELIEAGERMDVMVRDIAKVDEEAINAVKEQLSSAVGEAMLVRIEVDRFIAAQEEKFDAAALRMSEIEAALADTMDVSEAVQLERLEEIERALLELDPNQFVRKADATHGGGSPAPSTNLTLPSSSVESSSEHSYSSF